MTIDLRQIFTEPRSRGYRIWHGILTLFILGSCISLALETVPEIDGRHAGFFAVSEWSSTLVFTLDAAGNIAYAQNRVRYIFSLWGVIDIVSVLPSWLMLMNLTALRGTKVFRLLQVARVLRVLKLTRATVDGRGMGNPLRTNLKIYFIILFSVVMLSSTAMYYVEGRLYDPAEIDAAASYVPADPISGVAIDKDHRFFTSIPAAMWWSIETLTTTGYGDVYPVTVGGRIIAGLTMLVGSVLFGLLLNIVGRTTMMLLFGEKRGEG